MTPRGPPTGVPARARRAVPEPLAGHWLALHHPTAYHRAAVFEDLNRAEKADPARCRRQAGAVQGHFRASCYRRCAELARELPADEVGPPQALALFPPGAPPTSFCRPVAVVRTADALPRDSDDLRLLRRVTALRSSGYCLGQLASDPLWRKELDTAEARKWRDALAVDVNRERANVNRYPDAQHPRSHPGDHGGHRRRPQRPGVRVGA